MTIDRIKISSDNNGNIWIGAECTPDPGETPDEAFKAMQQKIAEWHTSPNALNQPLISKNAPAGEVLPTINRAAERLAMLIENAKDLQELHGYWEKASEHGLFKEYNEKENFLIAKEVENEH